MIPEHVKQILRKYTENAPVVIRTKEDGTKYPYLVLPFEGLDTAEFLNAVVDGILAITDPSKCTKIVTMEAKGIPIATALALRTQLPFVIARKRMYKLPGEIIVKQTKAYKGRTNMYINWIYPEDHVLVVDDIISSGGTLGAVIDGLHRARATIIDFVVVWDRGEGLERVRRSTNYEIKSLARLEIEEIGQSGSYRGKITRFYGES
jgi:adenine phosphoribosyltransferase